MLREISRQMIVDLNFCSNPRFCQAKQLCSYVFLISFNFMGEHVCISIHTRTLSIYGYNEYMCICKDPVN